MRKQFLYKIGGIQVVAAKERLDVKIEEKRIADLEAEIDAHNPSKKSTKLLSSASYSDQGTAIPRCYTVHLVYYMVYYFSHY